jgi:site-specific recombinase XerD
MAHDQPSKKLLYSSGLPALECVRLRVKDIEFERQRLGLTEQAL